MLAVFGLTSCSESRTQPPAIDSLRIGILPDEEPGKLTWRYTPLAEYLSQQMGVPYQLVLPSDYNDLVDRFAQGQMDLAYFGGVTFLQAHQRSGAMPLVMRDVDIHFSSYFLAPAGREIDDWSKLASSRFSFGSRLSTSGHLMPRYFLGQKQIHPETFFSEIHFSGAHDKTAIMVRDGMVDFGVANAHIIDSMFQDGSLDPDSVQIFWETPPYADYVWAVRSDSANAFKEKLTHAFLSLSPLNEHHSGILEKLGAGGFIPASVNDFFALQQVARKTGLLTSMQEPK